MTEFRRCVWCFATYEVASGSTADATDCPSCGYHNITAEQAAIRALHDDYAKMMRRTMPQRVIPTGLDNAIWRGATHEVRSRRQFR